VNTPTPHQKKENLANTIRQILSAFGDEQQTHAQSEMHKFGDYYGNNFFMN
jgi:hypothetical protein